MAMKGDEFISSLISFIVLFAIGALMMGLIVWTNTYADKIAGEKILKIEVGVIHLPLKFEDMMLSYLETTSSGIPMKRALIYAAYQGTNEPIIDGNLIDLNSETKDIIVKWMGDKPYILTMNINGVETVISTSLKSFPMSGGQKLDLRKINVPIIYPNGVTTLSLYVGG